MVFISLQGNGGTAFEKAFKEIRRVATASSARGSISLLIVVPLQVDALCAARILSTLLSADFIPYKIIPIRGVEDILRINELYIQGSSIDYNLTVFFINCAGGIDVSSLLSLSSNTTAYIVDSQRPFHLSNIFENSQVVIFDDGELDANYDYLKELYQYSEILAAADENSNNIDTFVSADQSDDDTSPSSCQLDNHSNPEMENLPNSSLTLTEPSQSLQKNLSSSKLPSQQQILAEAQSHLESYYSSYSFGSTAASLLYALANSLSKETNDYLWNAILALTEQTIFHQISHEQYESNAELLQEEVIRLNSNSSDTTERDAEESVYRDDYVDGRIDFVENEYKFVLLRHWNLYDSIKHAEFVASHLGIWKEKGIQKLEMILAKMGIPLKEAKQSFNHLSFQYKSTLYNQIMRIFPEWGLEQICYPSFLRSYSYGFQASASDVVLALLSTLQQFQSKAESNGWHDAFFASFRMLQSFASSSASTSPVDPLKNAIFQAISNQKNMMKLASQVMSRKLIKQFKSFRFVVLKDPIPENFDFYSVAMLGNFLTTALEAFGKRAMPIVLASTHEFPPTFFKLICVGVWKKDDDSDGREDDERRERVIVQISNFKQLALEMSLQIVMDCSQFCQVVVPADRMMDFVSRLSV